MNMHIYAQIRSKQKGNIVVDKVTEHLGENTIGSDMVQVGMGATPRSAKKTLLEMIVGWLSALAGLRQCGSK